MKNTNSNKASGRLLALALGVSACTALPAWAHHGTNISYDRSKQWTTDAVVTKFVYQNPHPQLYVDLQNDKGEVVSWALELLPNPAQLIRNGWSRQRSTEVLGAGTKVVVTIAPSRAGGTTGLLLKVVNEKGEEIVTAPLDAGGPNAPATP